MYGTIFGNFDLASLSIWLFWAFFALLIYYLQTENMREGYPLENEDGGTEKAFLPMLEPKTFILPNNQGVLTVPNYEKENRTVALERVAGFGHPLEPTGDPMLDGVGPASWAPRKDVPELDHKGHPKIQPMTNLESFRVSAGRDPRGLPVQAGDMTVVGTVTEMWVDEPEQLVRYLEFTLDAEHGGGTRLVPIQLARILKDRVKIHSIYAAQFAGVPQITTPGQVSKLEEDKICGYYAGGKLYASKDRFEPQLG